MRLHDLKPVAGSKHRRKRIVVHLDLVEEVTLVLAVKKDRDLAQVHLLDLDLRGDSCRLLDVCPREVLTISHFPQYIFQ